MMRSVALLVVSAALSAAHILHRRSTNSELYGGQFDGAGFVRDLSEQVMSKFYLSLPVFYTCNSTFQDQRSLSDIYMKVTQGKLQEDISLKVNNYSYVLEPFTSADDWFLVNIDFIADTYSVVLNFTVSPLRQSSPESTSARVDVTNYLSPITLYFMGEAIPRQASSSKPTGQSGYTVTPLTSSMAKKIYSEVAVRLVWEYYYFDNVRDKILDLTYSISRQMDVFKYFS